MDPVVRPDAISGTTGTPSSSGTGLGTLGERYQYDVLLGQGGAADVYRAHDLLLDRDVAVKILRSSADDEVTRSRFASEARLLAQLSHPSILTLLDAGITATQPYLVMELVEGSSLSSALRDGPMAPERAAGIGAQLADALAYAHGRGVVHRDVKPSNVLLTGADQVKLADFGIARLIGDTSHHTATGQTIGTAAYLAPEQITGRETDGRADVYSLGLVLLETMTGERAYPGTPTEAALARISLPPRIPTHIPAVLRTLLTRMTCLEPGDRPTAAEVADRLRSWSAAPRPEDAGTGPLAVVVAPAEATAVLDLTPLAGAAPVAPVPRVSPGLGSRIAAVRATSRRHRTPLAVAAAIALMLAGVVVAATLGSAHTTAPAAAEQQAPFGSAQLAQAGRASITAAQLPVAAPTTAAAVVVHRTPVHRKVTRHRAPHAAKPAPRPHHGPGRKPGHGHGKKPH